MFIVLAFAIFFLFVAYWAGKYSITEEYKKRVLAPAVKDLELREVDLKLRESKIDQAQLIFRQLQEKEIAMQRLSSETDEKIRLLEKKENCIKKIQSETSQCCPWLSTLYADLEYVYDKKTASALLHKSRPAPKASYDVARISREKREWIIKSKGLQYQLDFLISLFPWLDEFKELDTAEAIASTALPSDSATEYDTLKNWLSPEEYATLPRVEKYQLALDRYVKRKKSNWQIGIEYERFVGYEYEQQGYRVRYNGALEGLRDMGRDLIATKDNEILVIQCKRWSKEKTVHEKHIFQLYGSVVLKSIENPSQTVKGTFITTATLSSIAENCAAYLGIQVIDNHPMGTYPLIKCNISVTGEKIYHLPFDQQYDSTMINPKDGDSYAYTVLEAEEKGFRRAYRWHSHSS